MHRLNTHFQKLLSNILPPQDRLDAAKTFPPLVRDFLKGLESYTTLTPHSRLAGSYAQNMCVGDVKDVDFVVRIDGIPEGDEMTAPRTAISNLKTALQGLAKALGCEDAGISISPARRSVHVHFKDVDFHLDVVPCIAPDGIDQPLWVPCKQKGEWVKSNPIGYIEKLNDINNELSGNVKPLGRLFKHFIQHQMKYMRPKSYWLGALLLQCIEEKGFDVERSPGENFHWLISEVYTKYKVTLDTSDAATPNVKDPMLGHNISWNWSRSDFESFMRHLKEARSWSEKALSEEVTKEQAIKYWQTIFGSDHFPASIGDEAKIKAEDATPGKSLVSGLGRILVASGSVPTVQSISTRFHGGDFVQTPVFTAVGRHISQNISIRKLFPGFSFRMTGRTAMWKGRLQPNEGGPVYRVSIKWAPRMVPEVRIISPRIPKNAPHRYSDGRLCLYWHKDDNWSSKMSLANTIIPWAAIWLQYFELWEDTGKWLGPESPH